MPAAKLLASTFLAAVWLSGAALAQSAAPPSGDRSSGAQSDGSTNAPSSAQPAPQAPGESTSPGMTHPRAIDDEDLRKFAAATAKIRLIDRDYTKKKDGKSDAERAALSKEEEAGYLAAVQEAGLTPELYNAISKQIQDDPALAKKAYEYIYAAPVK